MPSDLGKTRKIAALRFKNSGKEAVIPKRYSFPEGKKKNTGQIPIHLGSSWFHLGIFCVCSLLSYL